MKKLTLLTITCLVATTWLYAATQYQRLGNVDLSTSTLRGGLGLWSRTAAQLNTLTPTVAGQIVYCSNCSQGAICISTGTTTGAWVVVAATSSVVVGGLLNHCN